MLGSRVSPQICRAHRDENRKTLVFVLACHVWHLGVESLDLSTCRLIPCFPHREQPSNWGSATIWTRSSYVMSPVYVFGYGLTSIKPNRRAWYFSSRNSQDVAIASSHCLTTSRPLLLVRRCVQRRILAADKGVSAIIYNTQHESVYTTVERKVTNQRSGERLQRSFRRSFQTSNV